MRTVFTRAAHSGDATVTRGGGAGGGENPSTPYGTPPAGPTIANSPLAESATQVATRWRGTSARTAPAAVQPGWTSVWRASARRRNDHVRAAQSSAWIVTTSAQSRERVSHAATAVMGASRSLSSASALPLSLPPNPSLRACGRDGQGTDAARRDTRDDAAAAASLERHARARTRGGDRTPHTTHYCFLDRFGCRTRLAEEGASR